MWRNQCRRCAKGDSCLGPVPTCRRSCENETDCLGTAIPVGDGAEPRNIARCSSKEFYGNGAPTCTVPCNPVPLAGASGCASGLGCNYLGYETTDYTDCQPPGEAEEGEPCTPQLNCRMGPSCVGLTDLSVCRVVCRPEVPEDCSNGDVCITHATPVSNPMFGFCCPASGC